MPAEANVVLALVARIPRAGTCKTRLVPPLDHNLAAELSRCFMRDTLDNLTRVATATGARIVAAHTPGASEPELRSLFGYRSELLQQRGSDFGARLTNTMGDLFAWGYRGVCLIGSDTPTLPADYLVRAVQALQAPGDRVVVGPAVDGGYYLLGLKRAYPELFKNVLWSTPHVCRQTCTRVRADGIELLTLPTWYDVDDGVALDALCAEFATHQPPGGYAAPATRDYLRTIGICGGSR